MKNSYEDVRIYYDEQGNITKVERLATFTTQPEDSSFLEIVATPMPGEHAWVDANEYFTRSDEPEPAWMVRDIGPGHPRIMVLQGTWKEDTPEDQ